MARTPVIRIALTTATALIVSGALSACIVLPGSNSPTPTATSTPAPSSSASAAPSGSADLAAFTAVIDAALTAVPGAVVDIDPDNDGGVATWEVTVRGDDGRGTEVTIDRSSLKVIATRPGDLPDEAIGAAPAIDARTAVTTAADQRPGSAFHSLELDDSRGQIVWEIETANGGRVVLDAATGSVLSA